MSMFYRKNGFAYVPEYENPGRTKQSFKDETDINRILVRAQKSGVVSHMAKHQAEYGDFDEFDFLEAQIRLARGKEIFMELPGEVRREFDQSPAKFFEFVNDPANADRLPELLPALVAPGDQMLDVSGRQPPETAPTATAEAADVVSSEVAPSSDGTSDSA